MYLHRAKECLRPHFHKAVSNYHYCITLKGAILQNEGTTSDIFKIYFLILNNTSVIYK